MYNCAKHVHADHKKIQRIRNVLLLLLSSSSLSLLLSLLLLLLLLFLTSLSRA